MPWRASWPTNDRPPASGPRPERAAGGVGGRPLALALQGGGAHGAYTWGVLDALLESGRIVPQALSGTSAGAMNALALAQGWTAASDAGRSPHEGAREALAGFWLEVAERAPADVGGPHGPADEPALSPALRLLLQWSQWLALSPHQPGPAQLAPLLKNPLREILQARLDMQRLQDEPVLALYVAATEADSGRLRLFGNRAACRASPPTRAPGPLSLDAALASACLPTLLPPVEIDGQAHWDGGFSANPALLPLVQGRDGRARQDIDVLLVLLTPLRLGPTPRSAAEVRARTLELAFQAPLMQELALLDALLPVAGTASTSWWQRLAPWSGTRWHGGPRWHAIVAELGHLRSETRLIARRDFLLHLRDAGRARAQAWWQDHGHQLGRSGSIGLADLLAGSAGSQGQNDTV